LHIPCHWSGASEGESLGDMKVLIASAVLALSACLWMVGVWIIFCLSLVFLVDPPKHVIWRNVLASLSAWLACGAIYWALYYSDLWACRSAIERRRSEVACWLVQRREQSRLVRLLLLVGTACLLLRIVMDWFQLARR